MTTWGWRRWGAWTAVALALAGPAGAQVRPMPRPAGLAQGAEDAPTPVSPASALAAAPDAAPHAAPHAAPDAAPHAAPEAAPDVALGPETNLPLPRFVSLKTDEGNARRGPGRDQRIDWVFVREDMPLLLTAEYENWRRVEDRDGMGGWVQYSLLSGSRTVIVDQNLMALRVRPEDGAPEAALLEAGVVARVESCDVDWCQLSAGGYDGWTRKAGIWGVGPDEVLD